MTPERLNILQVSSGIRRGGAERIAVSLHHGLQRRDQNASMAVAHRDVDDPTIHLIPVSPPGGAWGRALRRGADAMTPFRGHVRGVGRIQQAVRRASSPTLFLDWWNGREHFDYRGTVAIPDLPPQKPDVIVCHTLHGEYFDLRQLTQLSRVAPVVLTLHDEWLFTGHCAGTLGCERWRIGCGACPDLTTYPSVRRDATNANWRVKRSIYADSRLYVSAPSRWLMDRARDSILAEGAADWRVIENGVDLSIFRPGDRVAARDRLALPRDQSILLFAAEDARRNRFKDYGTVALAAQHAARMSPGRKMLLIVLGDSGLTEQSENLEIRFIPYESDLLRVAAYYQAADLYVHAARSETAGLTIQEALASGLPVIATAVGGIPEAIRSYDAAPGVGATDSMDRATGVLVERADHEGMGSAISTILEDGALRRTLSENAARDAAVRFDFERYIDSSLAWYREIVVDWRAERRN